MDARALLPRIDAGPGASVKDSFADLDLTPYGFRVLFTAVWIHRPATAAPAGPALTPVTTPEALTAWAGAHGGGPLFRPALLDDPRVTILARQGADGVTGGAVLHRGSDLVGVSNVFARTGPPDDVWTALPTGDPLVGYGAGDDLVAARRAGFRPVAPLRVWVHG